jgi:hypothetical protein
VIIEPADSAPKNDGEKLKVTETPAMSVKRFESAILNATDVTASPAPPMYPDAVLADANGS